MIVVMPRRNYPTHTRRRDPFAKATLGAFYSPDRLRDPRCSCPLPARGIDLACVVHGDHEDEA